MKPCPECGSTNRKEEGGEYALLEVSGGKLKFDLDSGTRAVVVRVSVCGGCGLVSLREA